MALDGSAQALHGGAGAMACESWAAGVVGVCSCRTLVRNYIGELVRHKTALDVGWYPDSVDYLPDLAWVYVSPQAAEAAKQTMDTLLAIL